jgi:hypothetical protein
VAIETVDLKLKYTQIVPGNAVIEPQDNQVGMTYTSIPFCQLCQVWRLRHGFERRYAASFQRRVYDMCALTPRQCVFRATTPLIWTLNLFRQYCELYQSRQTDPPVPAPVQRRSRSVLRP